MIAFSRHDGQPVKVMTFMDIEEESLECYYIDGMELPDGLDLGEGKVADGDDELSLIHILTLPTSDLV